MASGLLPASKKKKKIKTAYVPLLALSEPLLQRAGLSQEAAAWFITHYLECAEHHDAPVDEVLRAVQLQPAAFISRRYHRCTMLGLAAQENDVEVCQLLIDHQAGVLDKDADHKIALDRCTSHVGPCFELLQRVTRERRMYRKRYELDGTLLRGGKHVVVFGTDAQHQERRRVALKLFEDESEYLQELHAHQACTAPLPDGQAPVRHVSTGHAVHFVAPIVEYSPMQTRSFRRMCGCWSRGRGLKAALNRLSCSRIRSCVTSASLWKLA